MVGRKPDRLFARVQALVDGQSDAIIGLALEAGRWTMFSAI